MRKAVASSICNSLSRAVIRDYVIIGRPVMHNRPSAVVRVPVSNISDT
jgi:hypothetical protein